MCDLYTPSPATNCHTLSDPSIPLARDILNVQPPTSAVDPLHVFLTLGYC